MDYRLVFTKRALSDLNQVIGRIADVDHDIDAAFHFGTALLDHVDLLTRFPRMAPVISARSRIRKLVHSPIVVYYRVHDQASRGNTAFPACSPEATGFLVMLILRADSKGASMKKCYKKHRQWPQSGTRSSFFQGRSQRL